ncbi:MAG: HAD family hydrolase [Alphaproteobacteria bacterium]|nr:HAD family hydrolase [Alphaproteobacteria bacterium]
MSEKLVIKNIFWDVDGVLVDLNHAYFEFLTKHEKYKDIFKGLKYQDLAKALPVNKEKYGAMDLITHPTLGKVLDHDFCHTDDFYFDRPLYEGTAEVLAELDKLGYRQLTMSAGFDMAKKKEMIARILGDSVKLLTVEVTLHGDKMHDTTKEEKLIQCMQKYGLKPEETILVDDRIYNIYSALRAGVHPVRFRSEFTTDLPEDLRDIPEVGNIYELKDWLLNNTIMK